MSDPYIYRYTIDLPTIGTARITPCGAARISVQSYLIELGGARPFYVHCLHPVDHPEYYQLTGQPGQFPTLAAAIAAQLAPLQGGTDEPSL